MSRWSHRLAKRCVQYGIVEEDQLPWFIYGVEKRLSTAFISVPFLLLALILTTPGCTISMYLSFYLLRRRASGYHANNACLCLCISLLLEIIFLILIYPLLRKIHIILFLGSCIPLIFKFAPYRDPNMKFTTDEISACQSSARITVCILTITVVVTYTVGLHEVSKGLTIGITMATVLLCTAHILERRKNK